MFSLCVDTLPALLVAVYVVVVTAVAGGFLLRSYRRSRDKHQLAGLSKDSHVRGRLHDAISTTHTLDFHAAYVRATDFLQLGELCSHEQLRDRGMLTYRDTISALETMDDFVVFFSVRRSAWDRSCAEHGTAAASQEGASVAWLLTRVAARRAVHSINGSRRPSPTRRVCSTAR
jgi:hypothetical protein